ncbi:hypothetical protein HPB51_013529 [Rhipicephalus microplus]|uniref:Uncharacterized protein n=1 Tax=Rhipicephalus microplus TaxID=6941 RepID=A0A9J6E9F4_RHIMP|nr:hypothetical protein HPB51_013529 [Rhipicephalus microplus]
MPEHASTPALVVQAVRPPQLPHRTPMLRLPSERYKIAIRPRLPIILPNIGLATLLEAKALPNNTQQQECLEQRHTKERRFEYQRFRANQQSVNYSASIQHRTKGQDQELVNIPDSRRPFQIQFEIKDAATSQTSRQSADKHTASEGHEAAGAKRPSLPALASIAGKLGVGRRCVGGWHLNNGKGPDNWTRNSARPGNRPTDTIRDSEDDCGGK